MDKLLIYQRGIKRLRFATADFLVKGCQNWLLEQFAKLWALLPYEFKSHTFLQIWNYSSVGEQLAITRCKYVIGSSPVDSKWSSINDLACVY